MSFRIVHLSDPHIGPMPRPRGRELIGKRVTGYLNWKSGRRHAHDMGALAQIVADLKAHHPNHVAMTGDISNIGLPAEFQLARSWLETLGPAEDVSFVPGNHDAYVRGSMPDLARAFAPWTTGDGAEGGQFPYLRVRGHVALIGLSSGAPTPFFIASGRLGREQLAAAETLLRQAADADLVRVIMLHHPPRSVASSIARGLTDARDFEALMRRVGAELILHGHNHKLSVTRLEGPAGPIPVVGAPSASAIRGAPRHRAGYNLFEISGSRSDYKIEAQARGLLPGAATIGDLGPIPL
ncbi:metallophosphoesterase family protein [Methylocapsa acidiphila]|uniref:metallophosphoesterase family protein n=1 Tax=Methylocapsa acidiphila TaxID=133552 RepID=UPI000479D9E3|nr:metallophosphoesterase [Methylocapsa acidiphila]